MSNVGDGLYIKCIYIYVQKNDFANGFESSGKSVPLFLYISIKGNITKKKYIFCV